MLIEFYIDYFALTSHHYYELWDAIDEWARKHKVEYTTKRKASVLRLCFNDERYYQWFALTWTDSKIPFRIVEHRTN